MSLFQWKPHIYSEDMELYGHLASVYDELFPPNPRATAFLLGLSGPALGGGRRALDIGAATGSQALDLAAAGWSVSALEPEPSMLARAAEKAASRGLAVGFSAGTMLEAASRFKAGSFDLLLCLGNTLPHLSGLPELDAFLEGSASLLAPGGRLVLQLLNYRPILEALGSGGAFALPDLASEGVSFRRRYGPGRGGRLAFLTELSVGGAEPLRDESLLFPFLPADLESGLAKAGFSPPEAFASWDRAPFDAARDPFLILVAGNPA